LEFAGRARCGERGKQFVNTSNSGFDEFKARNSAGKLDRSYTI
jgi:hypothetical protein